MLAHAARFAMLLTLVVAPWWFGGTTGSGRAALAIGTSLAAALATLAVLRQPPPDRHARTQPATVWPLWAALLPIAVGGIQLVPGLGSVSRLQAKLASPTLNDWLSEPITPPGSMLSWAPAATQVAVAELWIAAAALGVGVAVFGSRWSRANLLRAIAVVAAAVAVFGLYQQATWNGQLYGTVPLSQGGTPFGPYVNRNNATGYLNLGLAAAAGWAIASLLLPRAAVRRATSLPLAPLTTRTNTPRRRPRRGPAATPPPSRAATPALLRRVVVPLAMAAAIVAGVFLSASRGGAAASLLIVAALALGLLVSRRVCTGGRALAGVLVAAALVGFGITVALGGLGDDSDVARLNDLRSPDRLSDGRLVHWRETLAGSLDGPFFGFGLGTYDLANPPYQNESGLAWYRNADGEPVEWWLETGVAGCLALLVFLGLLVASAVRLLRSPRAGAATAGVVLAAVLLGQGLQALFDFGITQPANLLTAAVLIGSCLVGRGRRTPPSEATPLSRADRGLLVALAIGCVPAVWVLAADARIDRWIRTLPPLASMPTEGANSAADAQQRLEARAALFAEHASKADELLLMRPGDARLFEAVAELDIAQLRLDIVRTLRPPLVEATDDAQCDRIDRDLWRRTSPTALRQALTLAGGEAERPPALDDLLPSQAARAALRRAVTRLRIAEQQSPLRPRVRRLRACLDEGLDTPTRRRLLTEEAVLSPNRLELLRAAGAAAAACDLRDLATRAWWRVMDARPGEAGRIIRALPLSWPAEERRRMIAMAPPEATVAYVRRFPDEIEAVLTGRDLSDWPLTVQADLATLQNRTDEAAALYREAIAAEPLRLEPRLRLIELLVAAERREEAGRVVQQAAEVAPGHPAVRRWQQRLAE